MAEYAQQLHKETLALVKAYGAADEYLKLPVETQNYDVIQVHVEFIVQRIEKLESMVARANERLSGEEVEIFLPDETEPAYETIRELRIRGIQLKQLRAESEKREQREADKVAFEKLQLERQFVNTLQQQPNLVVSKPALPPLPIPRFSGDPMKYAHFINIFDETVHKNSSLSHSQKLVYLQGYMEGTAKEILDKILVSDENYAIARAALKSNYGHSAQTISQLYDKLHSVQKCGDDPFSIRRNYNEIENILQMLEHAGVSVNTDRYLCYEVMKKWPFALVKTLVKSPDETDLLTFRGKLKEEVELQIQLTQITGYQAGPQASTSASSFSGGYSSATATAPRQVVRTMPTPHYRAQPSSTNNSAAVTEVPMPARRSAHCPFCKEAHHAEFCDKFTTAKARKEQLGLKKCHKCFREAHEGLPCINNIKCRYCPSYEHNRALCEIRYPETSARVLMTESKSQDDLPGYFMTFLAKVENSQTGQKTTMRVLLDPASNRTALTENAAQKIGIKMKNRFKKTAKGLGEREVEPMSEETVEIKLQVNEEQPSEFPVRLTAKIADDVAAPNLKAFREKYSSCNEYFIPETGEGKPVDMIIGSDRMLRLLELEKSINVSETCQLLATKFGWLIMTDDVLGTPRQSEAISCFTKSEDVVKLMWDLDLVGLKDLGQQDAEYEEKALERFYDTIEMVNGRYEVRWPWRTDPPNLNENYGLAMGRLRSLMKKLQNQPKLLRAYSDIIDEQIAEGVLEDIPVGQQPGKVVHYIPHHAVVVLEKSTPVRIVSDAAATINKQKSLNENMLKGKKWLGNTVASLLRFRKFGKAVSADIKHAFHQISINQQDRDAVRFIWVHDPSKPPHGDNIRILRFCRVAFGIVASPFLLYATIQYHLQKQRSQFASRVAQEMYADNLLMSLPSETDEVRFYEDTKQMFNSMGMNMTKWKSNTAKLHAAIPNEDKLSEQEISVLGLAWAAGEDTFGLRQPKIAHLQNIHPTKRLILKTMAAVFDPLGWVVPFVLKIRIFLRKLWNEKRKWDEELNEEDQRIWSQLKSDIDNLTKVKLTRMLFTIEINEKTCKYEIHTFVDASIEAIGVVSYIRQISASQVETAILMAKTRLAPEPKLSIPRLEFYALLMGVRLQKYVNESLDMQNNMKSYIWGDSKCVLAWIDSNKLLPVAVEKHLAEIRNSGVDHFRYVPTASNPADVASRGTGLQDLMATHWLEGPHWLKNENDWPEKVDVTCEKEEPISEENKMMLIQGQNTVEVEPPFGINPLLFGDWELLLRKTAFRIRVLNFICRKQIVGSDRKLDYAAAARLWLRWDQRRNGSQDEQLMAKVRHFKGVEIFHDQHGILRCRSRLTNSKLPWTAIEPAILVKGSHITRLIVLSIHAKYFHIGTSQTLATLRKRFWLVHGRREVYRLLHENCIKCRWYDAPTMQQPQTAPLPEFRVTKAEHPFQNTGIDILGPFFVEIQKADGTREFEKRWILILTCLVVRAVHLEVLKGVETIDIICALKRFCARRGTPHIIVSDNAKQFKLVDRSLCELWADFGLNEKAQNYFAEEGILWKYTHAYAPWEGGAYERLIQIAKRSFKRTYGEQELTEREFNTSIIEIEGIMNQRPLTYVDREFETTILTPNHFLRVTAPAIPIDVSEQEGRPTSTKQRVLDYWKAAEEGLNYYWKVWSEEYLLALREIKSKNSNQKEPKIGEVVIIADPNQPRGNWRVATIERLIQSRDGKCRAAQVHLRTGVRMIRPLSKLVSLEILDPISKEAAPEPASYVSSSSVVEDAPQDGEAETQENNDQIEWVAPGADPEI